MFISKNREIKQELEEILEKKGGLALKIPNELVRRIRYMKENTINYKIETSLDDKKSNYHVGEMLNPNYDSQFQEYVESREEYYDRLFVWEKSGANGFPPSNPSTVMPKRYLDLYARIIEDNNC